MCKQAGAQVTSTLAHFLIAVLTLGVERVLLAVRASILSELAGFFFFNFSIALQSPQQYKYLKSYSYIRTCIRSNKSFKRTLNS